MTEAVKTVAILFADIGGSTRLYESVGDVEAHRQVAESLAMMSDAISAHSGQLLRTVGDSSLASFSCCDDALMAACDMQLRHQHSPLSVRVGFHFGSVIPDKGDVYGNAVNIAARVASFARTNEVTATSSAIDTLSLMHRQRASLLDSISVKGVGEPVPIYRIAWQETDDTATAIASGHMLKPATHRIMECRYGVTIRRVDERQPTITLGRSDDNDITVNSSEASRHHAEITFAHGQFVFSDTSTNGTYITRGSLPTLFVRRDSIVLDDAGELGLGALPDEHTVSFRCKM